MKKLSYVLSYIFGVIAILSLLAGIWNPTLFTRGMVSGVVCIIACVIFCEAGAGK